MSDRVLIRRGAREMTQEETEQVNGGFDTGCRSTTSNFKGVPDFDFLCDPA